MHIRSFRATNLESARQEILLQMGDDAQVLHTRSVPAQGWRGWIGGTEMEVTAGLRNQRQKQASSSDSSCPPIDQPLVRRLIDEGVSVHTALRWFSCDGGDTTGPDQNTATRDGYSRCLHAGISEIRFGPPIAVPVTPPSRDVSPVFVPFIGPTGVGKTTTIAKLAASFLLHARRKVGLLTVDTFRVAAVQQLQAYADTMRIPLAVVNDPSEMRTAMQQLADCELVLIDTMGLCPDDSATRQRLAALLQPLPSNHSMLVLSATASRGYLQRCLSGYTALGAESLTVTKWDECVGQVSSTIDALGRSSMKFAYFTDGQNIPDAIGLASRKNISALCHLPITDELQMNTPTRSVPV